MSSSAELKAVIANYVRLLQDGTGEEIAALFAADGRSEDPAGGTPNVGHAELLAFYSRTSSMVESAELLAVRVTGHEAAAHFTVVSKAGDQTYRSSPIDTFKFNEQGQITELRAYWGPEDFEVL